MADPIEDTIGGFRAIAAEQRDRVPTRGNRHHPMRTQPRRVPGPRAGPVRACAGGSRATAEDAAPVSATDRPSLRRRSGVRRSRGAFDCHPNSNGPLTTVALTFAAHEY